MVVGASRARVATMRGDERLVRLEWKRGAGAEVGANAIEGVKVSGNGARGAGGRLKSCVGLVRTFDFAFLPSELLCARNSSWRVLSAAESGDPVSSSREIGSSKWLRRSLAFKLDSSLELPPSW